jgi:hypothetical protein
LGKDQIANKNNSRQEKRWNHSSRKEATFPVDESSVGGKAKSCE